MHKQGNNQGKFYAPHRTLQRIEDTLYTLHSYLQGVLLFQLARSLTAGSCTILLSAGELCYSWLARRGCIHQSAICQMELSSSAESLCCLLGRRWCDDSHAAEGSRLRDPSDLWSTSLAWPPLDFQSRARWQSRLSTNSASLGENCFSLPFPDRQGLTQSKFKQLVIHGTPTIEHTSCAS